jgi:multisubunit Na+/H+ antiporter MnhB subunit
VFADSSHRPTSPALVLERGFGDCKDKSLLAVTLLRSLGFHADVALVSSTSGELLPRLLPAISSFDHVVVTIEVDGVRYWLDPTRLHQRGTLADVSARNFRYALRLADGVSGLEEIQEPREDRPNVSVVMRYSVKRFGGPTELEIGTTYVGAWAELVRSTKESTSAKQLSDQLAAPVLKIYPRSLAGAAQVSDDEAANEVTVRQGFELDADDWTIIKEERKALAIFPAWLGGVLPTIPADRKNPVVTAYPLTISHHIEVRVPMPLSVTNTDTRVPSPLFDLRYRSESKANTLLFDYVFDWRARRIEPADFASYRRAVAEATRLLDINLLEPLEIRPASRATLFLSVALWSVVLLGALWYVQIKQPYFRLRRVAHRPELAGRRGWLALLGFGVMLSPLRLLVSWTSDSAAAYSQDAWTATTSPGSLAYHAAWEPLLTGSLLANLTLFSIASYSVYLYWSGRRSFPLVYSALLVLTIVSIVFDMAIGATFEPAKKALDAQSSIVASASVIAIPVSVLWIAYLSRSERVKATFLRKPGKRRAHQTA